MNPLKQVETPFQGWLFSFPVSVFIHESLKQGLKPGWTGLASRGPTVLYMNPLKQGETSDSELIYKIAVSFIHRSIKKRIETLIELLRFHR